MCLPFTAFSPRYEIRPWRKLHCFHWRSFCEGRNWAVAGGMLPFQDLLGVWRARATRKVAFLSHSTQDWFNFMSVLELQPQYELQVYKLLLGAADLAAGGGKWGGKVEKAGRLRISTYTVRASEQIHFTAALGFSSVPNFNPRPLLSLVFVSCLKHCVFFFPQKDVRWDREGETGLCCHSVHHLVDFQRLFHQHSAHKKLRINR